jgi:hypothetical protein
LDAGTYPILASTQSTVILSTSAPDINQVSSKLFGTNICFSQNGIQEDATANVIYSRAIDLAFGAPLVSSINSDSHFLFCQTGIFNYLAVTLMDQDFRILKPHDLQCIIFFSSSLRITNTGIVLDYGKAFVVFDCGSDICSVEQLSYHES